MAAPSLLASHLTLWTIDFYLYLSLLYFPGPFITQYWSLLTLLKSPCVCLKESVSQHTPYTLLNVPPRGCEGWWAWPSLPSYPWGSSVVSCWGSGEVAGVIDTVVSQVRGQAVTGSNNSSHVDRTVLMTHGVLSVGGASSGQVSFV